MRCLRLVTIALVLWAAPAGSDDLGPAPPIATVGIVDAMATGPTVAERLAEIRRRIQAAVVYPPIARRSGLEGLSRVGFEIGPDGRAREVRVEEASGHSILDRAAEKSVVRAGELPRVYGRLSVPVRFALEDHRK